MIDLSNSTIKVYRDENDKYFTYLTGNIFNLESKEKEIKFYTKRKIKFVNAEVKNKSKIKVLEGFVIPYKFKLKDENGGYKYLNGEVYCIKSFQLLEDGIDEKQKPFVYKKPQTKQEQNKAKLNSFSFNEYSGVTPF